jgi:hypothetical protein
MRLTSVWSETSDTRETAGNSSPADAVRLDASVSPHEVIAWQQTTEDESHDVCCWCFAGNSCCAPAWSVIVIEVDADGGGALGRSHPAPTRPSVSDRTQNPVNIPMKRRTSINGV